MDYSRTKSCASAKMLIVPNYHWTPKIKSTHFLFSFSPIPQSPVCPPVSKPLWSAAPTQRLWRGSHPVEPWDIGLMLWTSTGLKLCLATAACPPVPSARCSVARPTASQWLLKITHAAVAGALPHNCAQVRDLIWSSDLWPLYTYTVDHNVQRVICINYTVMLISWWFT